MKSVKVVLQVVLIILAVLRTDAAQNSVKVMEQTLRKQATIAPKPTFPPSAVKAKSNGPAVASVIAGVNGQFTLVDVVQAPDNAIRDAVVDALRQWRVTPVKIKDQAREMSTRLVFYFHFINGQTPLVLNPDEVEGGPVWDASTAAAKSKRIVITPQRPSLFEPTREIVEADLKSLRGRRVILDVGERDEFAQSHLRDAVNIPMDELLVRGGIEMPRDAYVVVDCRRNPGWYRQATTLLSSIGFGRMLLLMP